MWPKDIRKAVLSDMEQVEPRERDPTLKEPDYTGKQNIAESIPLWVYVPLEELRRQMRALSKEDWAQLAREARGGQVIRLVNDDSFIALLQKWVER